jgi:NADPH2:quinone reductase
MEPFGSSNSMQAVGLEDVEGGLELLHEFHCPVPKLRSRDVLVRVTASAMNPFDSIMRTNFGNPGPLTEPKILGYDGAGIVEAIGSETRLGLKKGDRVYLSGSHLRNGTNADFVAADERLVGLAPSSVSLTQAASLPLALITAWESLFEHCRIPFNPHSVPNPAQEKRLLVLPGAGGTGSFAIQLGKLAGLYVVATASRPESMQACRDLGADLVINHREPLKQQLEAAGLPGADSINYIFNGFDISSNLDEYIELLAPLGKIVDIAPSGFAVPTTKLLMKSLTYASEFMMVRAAIEEEMGKHGEILNHASAFVDGGKMQIPSITALPWSAESLQEMHRMQASGATIGKLVMTHEKTEVSKPNKSGA